MTFPQASQTTVGAVGPAASSRRRSLAELLTTPGMTSVVIGASKDTNAKVTVMLVPSGGDRPVLAVKAATTATAAAVVKGEQDLLVALHQRIGNATVQATIPRVIESVEFQGHAAMVVTALPGTPMFTSYHRWRHTARPCSVAADFAAFAVWLERFQDATAGPPPPIHMGRGNIGRLQERFADEPDIAVMIDRLDAVHDRLGRSHTIRTAVHGDLWQGNLLLSDGRISGVVDWEAGAISGEPLRDLVRFPLMYALYLDRHTRSGRGVAGHPGLRAGTWGAGVDYAVDGAGWFPELFRRFLRDGLVRLGATPDCWRDLVLCGIADVAATTDDQQFGRRHLQLFRRLSRP